MKNGYEFIAEVGGVVYAKNVEQAQQLILRINPTYCIKSIVKRRAPKPICDIGRVTTS